MKKRRKFRRVRAQLKRHVQYLKEELRTTKTLVLMCLGNPEKRKYKRRLERDILGYNKKIKEYTDAIKILSR